MAQKKEQHAEQDVLFLEGQEQKSLPRFGEMQPTKTSRRKPSQRTTHQQTLTWIPMSETVSGDAEGRVSSDSVPAAQLSPAPNRTARMTSDTLQPSPRADVREQPRFFPAPARSAASSPVPLSALAPALEQPDMFASEEEQTVQTKELCLVVSRPTVTTTIKNKKRVKEWLCVFTTPPDLWHQDSEEWVHATTNTQEGVTMAQHAKLKPGMLATLTGVITSTRVEDKAPGQKTRHITFMTVRALQPAGRLGDNFVPPRRRR